MKWARYDYTFQDVCVYVCVRVCFYFVSYPTVDFLRLEVNSVKCFVGTWYNYSIII